MSTRQILAVLVFACAILGLIAVILEGVTNVTAAG
jgi:hypothetical protein